MKFFKPLDKILNQTAKVRILRFLIKTGPEWTGRQISKEIGVSPATCHKALRQLYNEGLLLFRSVGAGHLYKLNDENYLVKKVVRPLFEQEDSIYRRLKEILLEHLGSLSPRKLVSAVVFGSVSKKNERAKSDIDILLLVKKEEDKDEIEKRTALAAAVIIREYGNALSPYIQTVNEFMSKKKKKLPVIKEILKNHFVIAGKALEDL
ncbi:nucleotidyltransferase domain-containing protein [bacterium]|nr:winged helix-turn-helix transcriptional regulator [bacterium]MBU3956538.1 nucleotidyltransferase domain-containing protein [bacterium]